MKRATIADIAKLAGVGKATVSRVLNESGYVSDVTRKRVESVIRKNTFTPSAAARNLSKRESDTVGVVIPEADNSFFSEMLKGISNVADASDLRLIFCNSGNMMEKDLKFLRIMSEQRVKGVIFTPAVAYNSPDGKDAVRKAIHKLNVPVVLLDRPIDDLDLDGVFSDNFAGAYDATTALIQAGHRKIGIVTGDPDLAIGRERFRGFKEALARHDIPLERRFIVKGMFNTAVAYDATRKLLKERERPTAFFAANNLSGIGFLKAAFEYGLSVPGDVGFVSFDRLGYLTDLGYPFSYLDRDVVGMGVEAMRLLLAKIERQHVSRGNVVFPSRLVLLGSEALPKGKPAKRRSPAPAGSGEFILGQ